MPSAVVGKGVAGTANTEAVKESLAHALTGNPVGTSRSDVNGNTGNEFSRWSIEVVNPHSGPVWAKILEIMRGERKPT